MQKFEQILSWDDYKPQKVGRKPIWGQGEKFAEPLLQALLSYANRELMEFESQLERVVKLNPNGWPYGHELWVTSTTLQDLVELTKFAQQQIKCNQYLNQQQIRNVLNCLKALGIFEDCREINNSKTRTNKKIWNFKLKFPSTDKQEILSELFEPGQGWKQLKEKWDCLNKNFQEERTPKPVNVPQRVSAIASPNWTKLCLGMLNHNKKLTIDCLSGGNGQPFEQLDFVPLGLLEQQPRNEANRSTDYEVTHTFDNQTEFFDQVLRQGKKSAKSKGRRLAIIGESGAGKTTLLLKIGFWVLENTEEVPIWIDMRDVDTKPLDQYLKEWLKKASGKLSDIPTEWIADLEERLQSGRVCLLLDGVERLATIPEQLTGARVVVNCRTSVWNAGKEAIFDFDIYKSLGFSSDQVKYFIESWFSNNANELWVELDQPKYQRIKDLVKNPLYLTFLCRIWQPLGKLPNTKAKLIQKFIEQDHKQNNDNYDKHSLINVLGRLALKTVEQDQSLLPYRAIFKEFNKLGVAAKELDSLAIDLGWIKRVSPYEDVYDFLHDSFRDYFAAIAIPEEENWHYFFNPEKRIYRIFEPKWKEIILLWLGSEDVPNSQKEALLRELVNFQDGCGGFYSYRAYFLAAVGTAEFSNFSLADQVIEQVVQWRFDYFNSKSQQWEIYPHIAQAARETLLETNSSFLVPKLIDMLATPCEYTCLEIADILRQIAPEDNEVIDNVIDNMNYLIDKSSFPYIRIKAELILANISKKKIGFSYNYPTPAEIVIKYSPFEESIKAGEINPNDPQVIESLIEQVYQNSIDKYKLKNSVKNLGYTLPGNRKTIEVLIEVIDGSTDEDILQAAVTSLGKVGKSNSKAIKKLIFEFTHNQYESVRHEAIFCLQHSETNYEEVIKELIKVIPIIEPYFHKFLAITLRKMLQKYPSVSAISDLKTCLNYLNNSDIYQSYNEILWHCSKNLPYPQFYDAWNNQSEQVKFFRNKLIDIPDCYN
jgi:energy-coupling factor transporter ATP-binding protein EcfA2